MGAATWARAILENAFHPPRRIWRSGTRAHIEIRSRAAPEVIGSAVEAALSRLGPVQWAKYEPVVPGVLVELAEGDAIGALVDVVEQVEQEVASTRSEPRRPHRQLPDDPTRMSRESLALMADAAGFGLALTGRLAHVARVPIEVVSVVSFVDSQPRLRRPLESLVGTPAVNAVLGTANALGQGLAQGPLALVVDGVTRVSRIGEQQARRAAWRLREVEFATAPVRVSREPPPERVVPLPPGPVERFADRAGFASLGALGLLAVTTRDLRRASATALAMMPKAGQQGRDVFAAHLGRVLASRGMICFDPETLRVLDRIDCLAIDAGVLASEATSVSDVITLGDAEPEEIERRALRLLRAQGGARPGRWLLRPLDEARGETRRPEVRRAFDDLTRDEDDADVLAVVHREELTGLVAVEEQLPRGAESLVEAARTAGYLVAVAGDGTIARRLGANVTLASPLVEGVRQLQRDGHGVALVSAADPDALQVADCGVGVATDGVPWGADLTVWDLESAGLVVEAAGVGYEVSRQSVAISLGGAAVGSVLAFAGPPRSAARRAMTAVNMAALLAQANAIRAAVGLGRRPVRHDDRDEAPWHELEPDEVLARLDTSPEGLSEEQAERRRSPEDDDEAASLPGAIASEVANPLTPVLAAASAVSGVVGSLTDAVVVGSVVALNGVIGGVQRFRVDRTVRALTERNAQPVAVRRGDEFERVRPEAVVPGDVLRLDAGDAVPADARILSADGLEVDESAVTGESVPVTKDPAPSSGVAVADQTSMLWDGTAIAAGTVEAVAVATGEATQAGRALAETGDADQSRTGVEARLRDLTRLTLPVSFLGGAAVIGLGLLRRVPLRESLQTGVNLAVAAVPEGLPILATMAQLASARRLAEAGALVRNPRAIEALGRVDVLCADKTGTLTEGRLVLRLVSDGEREWRMDELQPDARRVLAVSLRASPSNGDGDEPLPHLTDQAVVEGVTRVGLDPIGDDEHWMRIAELRFEPARAYHAVLGENGRGSVLSVKGAPEVIIPRCESWERGDTEIQLDDDRRRQLLSHVEELGLRGYRVLAVAERPASSRQDLDDERVDRLHLLGFVGLSDQLRPTAAEAAAGLQRAGVDVVIVTGDHPSTAEGIGAELGILDGGRVFTGQEIDELDDDQLIDALDDVAVFARVTPAHKVRLVTAYQRAGRTVAMTGDGANDAPAIKLADCGIAVGENSTPAARLSADLVVPDGRIETVVEALIEGRAMWSSVRDAIAILLGGNLGEVGFTLAGAAITGRSPLNARQLLLVNLLTDVIPATAVAVRPPRHDSAELVGAGPDVALGRSLERSILTRAVTTGGGAGMAWVGARLTGRRRRASTVALAALVGTQLGQTAVAAQRDPLVLAAAGASAAVLFGIVQTPGLSQLFGCTPLGPVGWSIATASSTAATAASALVPDSLRS